MAVLVNTIDLADLIKHHKEKYVSLIYICLYNHANQKSTPWTLLTSSGTTRKSTWVGMTPAGAYSNQTANMVAVTANIMCLTDLLKTAI